MTPIRTRFPPSPTGALHIGNARTALFNFLFARNLGGTLIFRIEDTDRERSRQEYEESIFDELAWLGITADEGPKEGGPSAPYRQSERIKTYTSHIEKLLKAGKAFYCFHSERELAEEKEANIQEKRTPIHTCEWRNLSYEEAEQKRKSTEDYVIRFKTPSGLRIEFSDLIRGELAFESDLIGDFSIARRVDAPLYHFAVVVDDQEMNISHVIRGEDHIPNTPKQLMLINALGFRIPHYAHLPLILGTDRSKLSKRHGATSVNEYKKMGYLPEALFNFIALLGWNPGDDREMLSREEMIQSFSLEHIQKSGAIFDVTKLDWMNGEYIRRKTSAELTRLSLPFLESAWGIELPSNQFSLDYIEQVIALEQPRLKKLSELAEQIYYFFEPPTYDPELLRWKEMDNAELVRSLTEAQKITSELTQGDDCEKIEKAFLQTIGTDDKGKTLWPLRAALTGRKASPGPFDIIAVLGKKEALRRIAEAIEKVS